MALSPDGQVIAAGYSNGGLKLWRADGSVLRSFREWGGDTIRWMTFTPDSKTLLYQQYNDESIWTWDLPTLPDK